MLERYWPWLVSVAAPAVAAAGLFVWVALAPQFWERYSVGAYRARSSAHAMSWGATATDVAAATDDDMGASDALDAWRNDSEAAEDYLLEGFYMRDRDRSGSLDQAEFVMGASQELRNRQTELFLAADRNADGVLVASEYRKALLTLSVAAHACEDREK